MTCNRCDQHMLHVGQVDTIDLDPCHAPARDHDRDHDHLVRARNHLYPDLLPHYAVPEATQHAGQHLAMPLSSAQQDFPAA